MDTIYDLELRKILTKRSKKLMILFLKEGVYLQTTGPAYESPAEVKMFGMFGADAVGNEHGGRGNCRQTYGECAYAVSLVFRIWREEQQQIH